MAVNDARYKGFPSALKSFESRDFIWLWCFLKSGGNALYDAKPSGGYGRALYLSEFIKKQPDGFIKNISFNRSRMLLDKSEVSFFYSADVRFLSFLRFEIDKCSSFNASDTWFDQSMSECEKLVAQLDVSDVDLDFKLYFLNTVKSKWSENIEFDRDFGWFDPDSNDQGFWLLDEAIEARLPIVTVHSKT